MEVFLQCSTKIIRVTSLQVFEQNIPFKISARYEKKVERDIHFLNQQFLHINIKQIYIRFRILLSIICRL